MQHEMGVENFSVFHGSTTLTVNLSSRRAFNPIFHGNPSLDHRVSRVIDRAYSHSRVRPFFCRAVERSGS